MLVWKNTMPYYWRPIDFCVFMRIPQGLWFSYPLQIVRTRFFFKYDYTKFTVELMCVFYYHCFLVIWVKAHLTPYCIPWSKVRDRHNFDRWYLDSKCAGPVVVVLDKTRWHFCKGITWSFHHSIWNASKYKNFCFNQWLGWSVFSWVTTHYNAGSFQSISF